MTEGRRENGKEDPFALPPATSRMKAFSLLVFFVAGFALGAFLFWNPFSLSWLPGGPGEPPHEQARQEEARSQLWTCPMHPEVIEKEAGTCPICGMKLVPMEREVQESRSEPAGEGHVQLWTCPMHPEVVEREPGDCPICGMKLVERTDRQGPVDEKRVVKVDPVIVQQIGVRTEEAKVGELRPVVRTVGILDYNDKNIFLVNTKFDGWIEKVYVTYIGEQVRKGGRLFEIYSPALVSTQEEYLNAVDVLRRMEAAGSGEAVAQARTLKEATRKRLAYWDVTEEQIRELEATREIQKTLTVVSPAGGVVIDKTDAALEGMYARAGANLYRIADLSTVWVHAEIYASQLPWVRPGLEADVTLPFFPGERFSGEVLFLQPFFSEKTRTVKACIQIENPEGKLGPGMHAEVEIRPLASRRAVQVPEDAVIRTGERSVVFVALGEGRFLPKEVVLGAKGEGVFEVKQGLEGGEEVVVSAQFLLDSESNLQEFLRKLTAGAQGAGP